MADGNIITRIIVAAEDKASSIFGAIGRAAGSLTGAIAQVGAGIAAVGVGFASWAGLTLFGDAVSSAEALDVEMRRLEGVIAATGGAAGLTAEQINEMAMRSEATASEFRVAAAELLTFKSVGEDVFERTMELAIDLAETGFGSVESSAVMMGKALENPVAGLGALGEAGVSFSEEQKKLIKSLVETGDLAQAQGLILDAVAGQVGGVAQSMGGGLSDAADLLSKRFTELKEQLGTALLPVLAELYGKIGELYTTLTESGAVARFGEAIASGFKNASDAVLGFVSGFDFASLIGKVQAFADTTGERLTSWGQTLKDLASQTETITNAIGIAWDVVAGLIHTAAATIAHGLSYPVAAFAKVAEAAAWLGVISDETAANFANAAESMESSAKTNLGQAGQHFREAGESLGLIEPAAEGAATATKTLATEVGDLPKGFANAAQSLLGLTDAQQQAVKATEDQKASLVALKDDLVAAREEYDRLISEGDAQGAAKKLLEIEALKKEIAALGSEAKVSAAAVEEAFKTLGVTSSAELTKTADNAKTAFETIRKSGTATPADIQNAFTAYATTAVAANDNVVNAVLQAQASQLGLKIAVSETGDVTVAKNAAAVSSYDQVIERINQQRELELQLKEITDGLMAGYTTRATDAASAMQMVEDGQNRMADAGDAYAAAWEAGDGAAMQAARSAYEAGEEQVRLGERTVAAGNAAAGMLKMLLAEIDSVRQYSEEAADALDTIFLKTVDTWQNKIATMNKLDVSSFINVTSVQQAQAEIDGLETAADEAAAAAARLSASFDRSFIGMGKFYDGLGQIEAFKAKLLEAQAAAQRTELAIEEMGTAVADLSDEYDRGDLSLAEYIKKLELLRGQYSRLSEDEIGDLSDALAEAREEQEDLTAAALDGLTSWREKLAGIYDQEVQIQQLNYQQDRLETEMALAEAKRNNNAEEIAALTEQLKLIDEYYALQIASAAADEAQAKIDAANDAADEAARRASLTEEERAYEDAINSLKDQLAAAIVANDAALQESLLAQIEAEKRRHETVIANLEAETKARQVTTDSRADTPTTATTTASRQTTTTTTTAASGSSAASARTVRLVIDSAELFGDEKNVNAFIAALERAGLTALDA
ncbi:hypothetical protein [Thiocystis violacea]|uniref:hypothetical protein n=1 Tax=Thiocystis violacea TaxID=13725 RepID=UPI001905D7A5|nr:hypothetical protein [Thiocystis violacea]MBK1719235.1 hypothetical protein [Thiocystis violacea]